MILSGKAACNCHGQDSPYFLGWQEFEKNPYDEAGSPNGIIQMGLAENQLSLDLLESWLSENPDPANFKRNGESILQACTLSRLPRPSSFHKGYGRVHGGTELAILHQLGEVFLLPAPYCPGFDRDLKWRTEVEIVPVQCTSSKGFRITAPALEKAYLRAQKRNLKVKGVLVTNPSNPLGISLTRQELNLFVDFIDAKGIHLISDEIYSGTVFSAPKFVSVMEVLVDRNCTNTRALEPRAHCLQPVQGFWPPGFRVGVVYSNDRMVVAAATKMSSFGLVSSQTQYLLSAMLLDKKFTRNIVENQKRLKNRQAVLIRGLRKTGISCLESNAGLFCWVDMRHLLSSKTFEAEMELWKKIVYEVGLNISPGSSCHCVEPGWFRVCFANMSEETLNLAIQRLTSFVNALNSSNGGNGFLAGESSDKHLRRKSLASWVFQLSFHVRERER